MVVIAGYLAGSSYAKAEKAIGRDGALNALAAVLVTAAIWKIPEHRATSRERTVSAS